MANIFIIGGGMSGLSVLHQLKKKYSQRPDVHIQLLEKNNRLGGTTGSVVQGRWIFELGPNGFLDTKEQMLQLIQELGLTAEVVRAHGLKKRYVLIKNRLHRVPSDFFSFLTFQPLSILDKLRIPLEILVTPGTKPEETVHEFGVRRFGENFARVILDPVVTGIFAGDPRRLNLKTAFPKLYGLEQEHRSVVAGILRWRRSRSVNPQMNPVRTLQGNLLSFRKGMAQLVDAFQERYPEAIQLNQDVRTIEKKDEQFLIRTAGGIFHADEIFLCVPAYGAAALTRSLNPMLADQLLKIEYAPVVVVGLVYPRSSLENFPSGFGYLIPSFEKKEILGVLFESEIFPGRSDHNHVVFRLMIGGARRPEVAHKKEDELIQLAKTEIQSRFGAKAEPVHSFIASRPQAIPQYTTEYVPVRMTIEREIYKMKGIHVAANYLGGVSLNDCVVNAQMVARQSKL